jgi:hypothetical protein
VPRKIRISSLVTGPIWLLVAMPFLLHLPDLAGVLSSNPLPILSGMAIHQHDWLGGAVIPGLPGWIDGNAGVTVQALGKLVARDWLHGVVPWWNPYSGVGMPLAGEYQPAAFFLPFILLAGLHNGPLLLKLVLQVVGGVSMTSLLATVGLAAPAALVGGILYELNGTFAWFGDSPILPIAFIPLALLGVEGARRGRWRTLAVAISYLVLAGFPETAFLGGLLVLAWSALRFFQAGPPRWAFAARLGLGGGVGLAIAAPQIVAFLDFLPDAYVGDHVGVIDVAVPAGGWAAFLFPYVNGPMFFAGQYTLWYSLGGYVGCTTLLLAVCGCIGRRERALRLVLLGWIFAAGLKIADAPFVTPLLDLVPMLGRTFFFRYSLPAISTAAIVLAALAIDDWLRRPRPGMSLAAGIVVAGLAGAALWADFSTLGALPSGQIYSIVALAWGTAIVLATGILLAFPATRRRRWLMMGLVAGDAAALFFVPVLSGRTDTATDTPTISFLQQHVGLQRVVTLAPLLPNYGAYFGIAEINYNAVPIPRIWLDRVRAIDPDANPIGFDGVHPLTADGRPQLAPLVVPHARELQALGVAYVVAMPGPDPLAQRPASAGAPGIAFMLRPGETLVVPFAPKEFSAMQVHALDLVADGSLTVEFCADARCGHGTAAGSGRPLTITLDQDVPVDADAAIRLTVTGTSAVSLQSWQGGDGRPMPQFYLHDRDEPELVYAGVSATIRAFAAPAPYAEAGPQCRLVMQNRTSATADCTAPATLIRRELLLPGWQATVNGTAVSMGSDDGIFQAVPIPAGHSVTSFTYAPEHALAGWIACGLGLALLIGWRTRA